MFQAVGVGAKKNDDGSFDIVVRFERNDVAPPKMLFMAKYTGSSKAGVKAQIDSQLTKLKLAEDDTNLQQQFVGVVLSMI